LRDIPHKIAGKHARKLRGIHGTMGRVRVYGRDTPWM
jgi:hypothetical protein